MFTLTCNVNGEIVTVSAEQRGRAIAVDVNGGATFALRNLNEAVRKAADVLGPLLERATRRGSRWGLYVAAGNACAMFGEFPPGPGAPAIGGPPAKASEEVTRIHDHWSRRDGSALGALNAAIKIIRIYANASARRRAA